MTDIEYLKKYYDGNIEDAIKRLNNGEPVQYIVGNVDFMGNIINVNSSVLIPRFETEELVSETIKRIKSTFITKVDILDLCTGSGCIAISLAKEIDSNIDATDISKDALEVAINNSKLNNTSINFINTDLYTGINKKYDVIISNPPYIRTDEEIEDIVRENEPHLALFAGIDGLDYYKKILNDITNNLKDDYLVAFEIGDLQREDITSLIEKVLPNAKVECLKDLSNRDRMIFIYN